MDVITARGYLPSFSNGYAQNPSFSAHPNLWVGLIGAWSPMIGYAGNQIIKEYSGKNASAALTNSGAWLDSPWGPAVRFPGTQRANLGTGLLDLNADFSLSGRLLLDDITHTSYCFLGCSVSALTSSGYIMFMHRSDKSGMTVQTDTGPGNAVYPTIATRGPDPGTWFSCAISRSIANARFMMALDGEIVISDTFMSGLTFVPGTTQAWFLGNWAVGGANPLNGNIADALVWDRALTAEELLSVTTDGHPFKLRTIRPYYAKGAVAGGVTGTLATTLGNVTSSAQGEERFTGSIASVAANTTSNFQGQESFTGTVSAINTSVAFSGSGVEAFSGTASLNVQSVSFNGTGTEVVSGSLLAISTDSSFSGSGVETFLGTASLGVGVSFAGSGANVLITGGGLSVTTQNVVTDIQVKEIFLGTASLVLGNIVSAAVGEEGHFGSAATEVGNVTFLAIGKEEFRGSISTAVEVITFGASGHTGLSLDVTGTISVTVANVGSSFSAVWLGEPEAIVEAKFRAYSIEVASRNYEIATTNRVYILPSV